jgi:hypothetical protein
MAGTPAARSRTPSGSREGRLRCDARQSVVTRKVCWVHRDGSLRLTLLARGLSKPRWCPWSCASGYLGSTDVCLEPRSPRRIIGRKPVDDAIDAIIDKPRHRRPTAVLHCVQSTFAPRYEDALKMSSEASGGPAANGPDYPWRPHALSLNRH